MNVNSTNNDKLTDGFPKFIYRGLHCLFSVVFRDWWCYKTPVYTCDSFSSFTLLLFYAFVLTIELFIFFWAVFNGLYTLLLILAFDVAICKIWKGEFINIQEKSLCIICIVFVLDYFFKTYFRKFRILGAWF